MSPFVPPTYYSTVNSRLVGSGYPTLPDTGINYRTQNESTVTS